MKILVFAPHPDDEILGMGGTMAKMVRNGHDVTSCIVTKGYPPEFDYHLIEQGRQEAKEAAKVIGCNEPIFLDIPSLRMNTMTTYEMNSPIQRVVDSIRPDVVYIPHHGDIHIEHKLINNAVMVATRPKIDSAVKAIYEYEVLSETGWDTPDAGNAFIPNVYEDISCYLYIKKNALECYRSQLYQYPGARSTKAVEALAVYRGCTIGVCAAEAFTVAREIR
ncbi:MAG: PIG-L family deacetylase [Lachnospiraceae bacterium]|nr:PIG-L family deacetylase [Lachnospiraceae bacterium]